MANLASLRLLSGRYPPGGQAEALLQGLVGIFGLLSTKIAYEDCWSEGAGGCDVAAEEGVGGCGVLESTLMKLTKKEDTFSSRETTTRMVVLQGLLRVMQQSIPVVLTTVEVTAVIQQDCSSGCVQRMEAQALVRLASCSSGFRAASRRVELAGRSI